VDPASEHSPLWYTPQCRGVGRELRKKVPHLRAPRGRRRRGEGLVIDDHAARLRFEEQVDRAADAVLAVGSDDERLDRDLTMPCRAGPAHLDERVQPVATISASGRSTPASPAPSTSSRARSSL